MSQAFKVTEHVFPGQHIREYPYATKGRQEDVLQLAAKQYVPLEGPDPLPEDAVTIIGAHGNGFPKEIYEPLWEDLCSQLRSRGVHIRGIWMADFSCQGASGVLNENVQGDSSNWFDHSRDLLLMINHFRDAMPRPLIGVAHSMGCGQLVHLSIMHPRLFSTLILQEPVILPSSPTGPNPAFMSTHRPDLWPTRSAAESTFRRTFSNWDPRCLSLYLTHGLRAVPTPLFNPAASTAVPPEAVTLTTTKHQEAWAFASPNLETPSSGTDGLVLSDWDRAAERPYLWAKPESLITMRNLPLLRPSVLYVFGMRSYLSPVEWQDEKVGVTGTRPGGSRNAGIAASAEGGKGGQRETVKKVVLEKAGHLCVFERQGLGPCVDATADWIERWFFDTWRPEEAYWRERRSRKSEGGEMLRVSEEWKRAVKLPLTAPRSKLRAEKL